MDEGSHTDRLLEVWFLESKGRGWAVTGGVQSVTGLFVRKGDRPRCSLGKLYTKKGVSQRLQKASQVLSGKQVKDGIRLQDTKILLSLGLKTGKPAQKELTNCYGEIHLENQ